MGRTERGKNLEAQVHKDLVIFTALLMGAEFYQPFYHEKNYWVCKNGFAYGYSRFDCARKWLWSVHGMTVRNDGSIYQNKNLTSEERHHAP